MSQETSIASPRIAFSTLAFPDADLATAVVLGRSWGYSGEHPGTELRQFLGLASGWEAPLVRVFGGALPRHLAVLGTWIREMNERQATA
jgi:hypothetical protein